MIMNRLILIEINCTRNPQYVNNYKWTPCSSHERMNLHACMYSQRGMYCNIDSLVSQEKRAYKLLLCRQHFTKAVLTQCKQVMQHDASAVHTIIYSTENSNQRQRYLNTKQHCSTLIPIDAGSQQFWHNAHKLCNLVRCCSHDHRFTMYCLPVKGAGCADNFGILDADVATMYIIVKQHAFGKVTGEKAL